jgi:hypothetical protein
MTALRTTNRNSLMALELNWDPLGRATMRCNEEALNRKQPLMVSVRMVMMVD